MVMDEFRHRMFFELSLDLLCIANSDGFFEELNPSWEAVLGWTRAELMAQPFLHFIHPDDIAATLEEVRKLSEGHPTISFENRYRTADGRWRVLNWTSGPDPATGKLYAIARDVTLENALKTELEGARRVAEAASQAKSAFLANMSHELRTPLNAVIGYSEMLAEDAVDLNLPAFSADLGKIRGAGLHLLGLINEVLDLSKVEAGKMEMFYEDLDLPSLVAGVIDTVRGVAQANQNRLLVQVDPLVGVICSDAVRVRQILTNVLANACKFTSAGEVSLSVRLVPMRGDGSVAVELAVRDTGIGIAADSLSRVFEPFSQADAGTTRAFGGTGLGLAITRRLVTLLGGVIHIDSALSQGTTVRIVLPTAPVQAEIPSAEVTSGSRPILGEGGPLVLVVDDDPVARTLLRRQLERAGYRVATAPNGQRALEQATELRPQLITLDLLMPVKDGWTAFYELRQTPSLAQIPVIMCSVLDERRLAFAAGVEEYLLKPVGRSELLDAVARRVDPPGVELTEAEHPKLLLDAVARLVSEAR